MLEQKNEILSFNDLGIADKLLENIKKIGLENPTPIQYKSIPPAIAGKDIVGIAQTGTGKTLAFSIPMIQRLALYKGRGLVLLPTRELASQVDENIRCYGSVVGLRTAILIGGEPINRQRDMLRRNPHVLIATPGRLNDFISRGWIKLDDIKILVLDEADMMLDMGFAPQIETIIKEIPRERQTMLFSATMPAEILKLAANHMTAPVEVEVAPAGQTAAGIEQEIYIVRKDERVKQLEKLLQNSTGPVLVFCRTKRGVKKLTQQIDYMGYHAAEMHSNRSQEQRRKALSGFKTGKFRVLVATDIAARGIDVKGIELVVNFDLPEDPGDYVHRIGRTGRAGKTGKAISFAAPDQIRDVRQIERLIKRTLPINKLADFAEGGAKENFARDRRYNDRSVKTFKAKRFKERESREFSSGRPSLKKNIKSRSSVGGYEKFKHQKNSSRPDEINDRPERRQQKNKYFSEGAFNPLSYFSDRPETRVMTDKERFRASLLGDERRPARRGKNSFSRNSRHR